MTRSRVMSTCSDERNWANTLSIDNKSYLHYFCVKNQCDIGQKSAVISERSMSRSLLSHPRSTHCSAKTSLFTHLCGFSNTKPRVQLPRLGLHVPRMSHPMCPPAFECPAVMQFHTRPNQGTPARAALVPSSRSGPIPPMRRPFYRLLRSDQPPKPGRAPPT